MQPFELVRQREPIPSVIATWRAPYSFTNPDTRPFKAGSSVLDIVKGFDGLPAEFIEDGIVNINGNLVEREYWNLTKPFVYSADKPIVLTLHMPPHGGKKGGGGKAVIGIVALLALTIATAGIASGGLAILGGVFAEGGALAAGTMGIKLLAGAVGLVGSLAISALTKPPTSKQKDQSVGDAPEASSSDGNVLTQNGAVPRVIGTRKVFPPLGMEPFVDLVGQDEYIELAAILNGPHAISNIKLGSSSITDDDAISYEVLEGWQSDAPVKMLNRYARTIAPNLELSPHKIDSSNGALLENATTTPLKSLPQWHRFTTRNSPDEVYLGLILPGGLNYPADPATYPLAVPIRIRIRKQGNTAWINLPEIHIKGRSSRPAKYQVILKWDAPDIPPSTDVVMTSGDGIAQVYYRCPIQTTAPADPGTYQWEADASFYSGAGNTYMSTGVVTGMQNIYVDQNDRTSDGLGWSPNGASAATIQKNTVHVFLNSGTFPKGIYEIEIMRGVAYATPSWVASNYTYGFTVYNLFKYYGAGQLNATQNLYTANIALNRISSVWKSHPLPVPGWATIAIRGKNKRIESLSCTASGYVRDWDGTGWNSWVVTSNPAPHYVDTLVGNLNKDPLPLPLLDNDGFVTWRARCITDGRQCNAIIEDMRGDEARDLIAACGRARSYQSDIWSVIEDYDRSAEYPVQIFSARNSRGFSFEKAFARLPDGLRVTYRNDSDDSLPNQVTVYREGGIESDNARLEQVQYEGLITEAEATDRAQFDLRQGMYRSTFYYLETAVEYLVCRRGSLVAVQHDLIARFAGQGRILSVNVVSSQIVSIVLDVEVDLTNKPGVEAITDILTVTDVGELGISMGCAIRRSDGTVSVHPLSNAEGTTDTLVFTTPITNTSVTGGPFDSGTIPAITEDCLVVVGALGSEYLRMIVSEITPGPDLTARLVLVDEAPELWD